MVWGQRPDSPDILRFPGLGSAPPSPKLHPQRHLGPAQERQGLPHPLGQQEPLSLTLM